MSSTVDLCVLKSVHIYIFLWNKPIYINSVTHVFAIHIKKKQVTVADADKNPRLSRVFFRLPIADLPLCKVNHYSFFAKFKSKKVDICRVFILKSGGWY